jgi:L-asparaginase
MTRPDESGAVVRLSGHDLVAGLGGLAGLDVEVRNPHAVPSANLSYDDVLAVVHTAGAAVAEGAHGIVLTQGTDTLEETAFLIDSVWTHGAPFVVTGAMRNPSQPGGDGPANLSAALHVAAADTARDRGALVVFDDEIHAARFVRKTHSTSTATFVSPDLGPIGHVVETVPRFFATLAPRTRLDLHPGRVADTRVALYTMSLDDDGRLLEHVAGDYQGLVVAAFGVGHVPAGLAPVLGRLAQLMPVVLTSRTGAGSVLKATYGAVGSESDLLARGLIGGGFVHPYKAKVLLRLLLANGATRAQIAAAFAELG